MEGGGGGGGVRGWDGVGVGEKHNSHDTRDGIKAAGITGYFNQKLQLGCADTQSLNTDNNRNGRLSLC